MMVVQGKSDLPNATGALGSAGRFAGGLNCRQEECNQHPNDADDDQHLNQRQSALTITHWSDTFSM
jgi:hypothetical protein